MAVVVAIASGVCMFDWAIVITHKDAYPNDPNIYWIYSNFMAYIFVFHFQLFVSIFISDLL